MNALTSEPQAPPHDVALERAALACMLEEPTACSAGLDLLTEDAFYNISHNRIFEALRQVFTETGTADARLIRDRLRQQGEWEKTKAAFMDLAEDNYISTNLVWYCGRLRELAAWRRLRLVAERIRNGEASGAAAADIALELRELAETATRSQTEVVHVADAVVEAEAFLEARSKGNAPVTWTGVHPLDCIVHGLTPGSLTVVGGRPATGKTALATNILVHNAVECRRPAMFFTAEVGRIQLVLNMARILAGVDWTGLGRGSFAASNYAAWQRESKRLGQSQLFLDDTPAIYIETLVPRALRYARKYDLSLIAVDYLQLLRTRQGGKRNEQVAFITQELKRLAGEAKCPVIVLSQLGRPQKDGPSNMPKWSGEVEEAADVVVLLGRDKTYSWGNPEPPVALRMIKVVKNRNGREGSFTMTFDKPVLRFIEREPDANGGSGAQDETAAAPNDGR